MFNSDVNAQLLMDFESTFKTSPSSSSAVKLPYESFDLSVDQAPVRANTITGSRSANQPSYGNKMANGTLVGRIGLVSIGYILKAAFGSPSTTGSAGSGYTHVFKIGNSVPSVLFDKGFTTPTANYYLHNGVVLNTLSFNFRGTDNLLVYNAGLIGSGKETRGAAAYDADPTDLTRPTTYLENRLVTVEEASVATTSVEEVTLNFSNNVTMGYGLEATGEGTNYSLGMGTIDGSIRAMFDATADSGSGYIYKGRNYTESSLSVILTSGSNSLTFAINELKFAQNSPAVTSPAGNYYDLAFEGYYLNHADISSCTVTLVNSQATY